MSVALTKRARLFAALLASAFALASGLLVHSSSASAAWSPYCGNQTLAGYGNCDGAGRVLYQTYGWGDQHSVCVGFRFYPPPTQIFGAACSSGPGVGVYSAKVTSQFLYPWIGNNAAGSNTVHGVALQP